MELPSYVAPIYKAAVYKMPLYKSLFIKFLFIKFVFKSSYLRFCLYISLYAKGLLFERPDVKEKPRCNL
jgi:hypothetical protein